MSAAGIEPKPCGVVSQNTTKETTATPDNYTVLVYTKSIPNFWLSGKISFNIKNCHSLVLCKYTCTLYLACTSHGKTTSLLLDYNVLLYLQNTKCKKIIQEYLWYSLSMIKILLICTNIVH